MLYGEIIAVGCHIHTKHFNNLCGQNLELFSVKLVVHIVTTGFCTAMEVIVYRESLKHLDLFTSRKFIMYFMNQNNTSCVQKYRYLANYTVLMRKFKLLF